MKHVALYIITSVIALGSLMSDHDMVRLPFLISHYQQHKAKQPVSFWEFLCMHYGNSSHPDHAHDSLPFKHSDCTTVHILVFLPPAPPSPPAPDEQSCRVCTPIFYHIPSAISPAIWQPPKPV